MQAEESQEQISEPGVPLGGLGSGYLRLTPGGRWRALSFPGAPGGAPLEHMGLALSVREGGGRYTRRLCVDPEGRSGAAGEPAAAGGMFLEEEVLFPRVTQTLTDPAARIRLKCACFSPVIPFDHDASVMPAVLARVEAVNTSSRNLFCSLMFTAMHPAGREGGKIPGVTPLAVEYQDAFRPVIYDDRPGGRGTEPEAEPQVMNALLFGGLPDTPDPGGIHACLAVRGRDARVTLASWDPDDPEESGRLWSAFVENGVLPRLAPSPRPVCGSLCASFGLPAGESQRVTFVFAWHGGKAVKGCRRLWKSAVGVAGHGLRHAEYLHAAVGDWGGRFSTGSVPGWLSQRLARGLERFLERGAPDAQGGIDAAGPGGGECGAEALLLETWAMTLLFPRFGAAALLNRLKRAARDAAAREGAPDLSVPVLALTLYRDYLFAGNLAQLREAYPLLVTVVEDALERGSGAGRGEGFNAPASTGLWAAALLAMAEMAAAVRDTKGGGTYGQLSRRAREAFESACWNETEGCYAPGGAEGGGTGFLAGPACAAMLHMEGLVNRPRLSATLAALARRIPPGTLDAGAKARLARLEQCVNSGAPWRGVWTDRFAEISGGVAPEPALVWPLLSAAAGFSYHAPLRRCMVHLRRTQGADLVVPLFTPQCHGVMRCRESGGPGDFQYRVLLKFGSPLMVGEIRIYPPPEVPLVEARCTLDDDPVPSRTVMRGQDTGGGAVVVFSPPLRVAGELRVFIREVRETPAQKGRP